MIARTLVALAVAACAGTPAVATFAQERGPGMAPMQGPGVAGPGPGQGERREAHGPMVRQGPGEAPGREAGARSGGGPGPGPQAPRQAGQQAGQQAAPQAPAFGQRPMTPPPNPAIRPNTGPAPSPHMRPMGPNNVPGGMRNFGENRVPGAAPGARPGPAPGAPLTRAPHAYGAVPAPYRGDIHRFVDMDARVWHGGRWRHEHHGGRLGWWWVVGGLWYFYPQPVYPYPDPYVPGDIGYDSAEPGSYWYYCQSAGQYYPYVTYCPEGWQAVAPEDEDE